jgi:hypothetical protein
LSASSRIAPIHGAPIRIAMWSGPRNISTAMMRAFENRADTAVLDEPFYAAWLARSGANHPMRAAILAAQPTEPAEVARRLTGPIPGERAIFYQKHMAHHMIGDDDLAWMDACRNVFLIRSPEEVLASYGQRRERFTREELGFHRQAELFEREAQRLGAAPPVIDARDVLENPRGLLETLCLAVGISFDPAMLGWPAGRRETDGVWAPAWYEAVERSTAFGPPRPATHLEDLPEPARAIAEWGRPYYLGMARHRLRG